MKTLTPTELRSNIYRILDEISATGMPVEINKNGKKFKIIPEQPVDKLKNLVSRPHIIKGNPEDLVHMDWEEEVSFDLP